MSPARFATSAPTSVQAAVDRIAVELGRSIRDARLAKGWTTQRLAAEAGVSRSLVYQGERGDPISPEAAVRLTSALGLRLEWALTDPRRREPRPQRGSDPVHSAMGECELRWLRAAPAPYQTALDDPYQHYQFAGRADVVAWDVERRALLHLENRTRFPDFQEMAGSYNAKRTYYGAELAKRLGLPGWTSETHLIVALWSAEVLHSLRLRPDSFRTLCPDTAKRFAPWLTGEPPIEGVSSSLLALDPDPAATEPWFVDLETALQPSTRPRYRGYANAVERLRFRAA